MENSTAPKKKPRSKFARYDKQIKEMYNDGFTYKETAQKLGIKVHNVSDRVVSMRKYGAHLPPRGLSRKPKPDQPSLEELVKTKIESTEKLPESLQELLIPTSGISVKHKEMLIEIIYKLLK